MNNDKWDQYVTTIGGYVISREKYQKVLGKLASQVAQEFGPAALIELASDIAENYGVRIGASTLRNYRYVWDKISHLQLPEDLSYRSLQAIASSKDPEGWANAVKEMGLSSAEVYRLIQQEKGKKPKTRTIVCDNCGKELNVT